MTDLNSVRRSTLATLDEIVEAEKSILSQGMDVRDLDEWQQLKDIVSRIEQGLKPEGQAELEKHIDRGFSPETI